MSGILCGADPPFERDARDFEAAAEIADVLGHPFLGLRGIAGANGGHQPLLRIGDARACLWNLVDHGAERRNEQLHQRLVRQHEDPVMGGFTHGVKELRGLFNGAAGVDILAKSRDHGLEGYEISRLALARRRRRDGRLERGERLPHIVIAHVVQCEGARNARRHVDALRARDHHELRAALAFEHAIGLELAQRLAHRSAMHAELARQFDLRGQAFASADGAVGDAIEQGGGHLAIGGFDANGLELSGAVAEGGAVAAFSASR